MLGVTVADLEKRLASVQVSPYTPVPVAQDVDPAKLRTKLSLKGPGSATLILTRVAGKRVALLAER